MRRVIACLSHGELENVLEAARHALDGCLVETYVEPLDRV